MKYGYILVMAIAILIFAFSIVLAAKPGDFKTNELGGENFLLNMDNISYAKCIRLDKEIFSECMNEANKKLDGCGVDNVVCENDFKAEKKACKNSFKNIKDNCALHRKTLLEILKTKL